MLVMVVCIMVMYYRWGYVGSFLVVDMGYKNNIVVFFGMY